MKRKIVWNQQAIRKLEKILNYLTDKWNEKVQNEFLIKTFTIIELIAENIEMGSLEDEKRGIRGFLLSKHNRLFYRYTDTQLIILNIYDTRQRPKTQDKGEL